MLVWCSGGSDIEIRGEEQEQSEEQKKAGMFQSGSVALVFHE